MVEVLRLMIGSWLKITLQKRERAKVHCCGQQFTCPAKGLAFFIEHTAV
jgi:hypothetical protein